MTTDPVMCANMSSKMPAEPITSAATSSREDLRQQISWGDLGMGTNFYVDECYT